MRASIAITFLFGLALCVVCSAVPVAYEEPAAELEFVGQHDVEAVIEGEGTGLRQKRATCDLLSMWNVNDTACAAHCLTKGFRGGWCDSRKVCNCRR